MDTLIYIWLKIGYIVYWVSWLVSVEIFNVSCLTGVGIGMLCFIAHIIILQILFLINGDGWLWEE